MVLVTKLISFFNPLIVILAFLISGNSVAQLKLELNFGDEDNYSFYKDATTGEWIQEIINKDYLQKGNFEIARFMKPSPAGGNYLLLDGIGHFLKLPSNADINLNGHVAYTVSMWMYLYSTNVNGEIINADNGFVSGYRFFIENNVPKLEIREGHSETFSSDTTLEASRWMHLGVYCDGAHDSVTFYVNGRVIKQLPFTKITQVNTGATSYIGALTKSTMPNFLKANLDQVRFFAGLDTVFNSVQKIAQRQNSRGSKKSKTIEPETFSLEQNYPNPFNLSTTIKFELRQSGFVELRVYDLLGNNIRTLYEGEKEIGVHEFTWDGLDYKNVVVPSGIYFVRLVFDGSVQTKKMVLVK